VVALTGFLIHRADANASTTVDGPTTSPPLYTLNAVNLDSIASLAVSADSNIIAAGGGGSGSEGAVMLWSGSGITKPTALLASAEQAGNGPVDALAFDPDGKILAIGNSDGTFRLWQVAGSASGASSTAVTAGAAGAAGSLYTGDFAPGSPLIGEVGDISALAFSPDGQTLAVAGSKGLQLWNVEKPQSPTPTGSLLDGGEWVNAVAFDPVASTDVLVAGDNKGHILAWNVSSTAKALTKPTIADGPLVDITALAFTPDGHWLIAGSSSDESPDPSGYDSGLAVLDATDPEQITEAKGELNDTYDVTGLTVISSDDLVAAVDGNDYAVIYGIGNPQSVSCTPWNSGSYNAVAFIPGTDTILIGDGDGNADAWALPSGQSCS
jgi:WD40 repeat protein